MLRPTLLVILLAGCDPALDGDVRLPGGGTDESDPTDDPAGEDDTEQEPGTDDSEDDCPPGLTCVDSFPWSGSGDTDTGDSVYDAYACSPGTDESGPEVVYRVELPADGFLALQLDGMPAGVDIDVHLLGSQDAGDCIDRGHWSAGALLPAGTWYVVADSWVSNTGDVKSGAYTLTMGFTPADAFVADGLREHVLGAALYAFDSGWFSGETDRFEYTVIDFELPSTDRRLWVIDLESGSVVFDELVTHGIGSNHPTDPALATTFSNVPDSLMSSLGLMRTAEVYYGTYGRSMRLDGLEPGFNSAVRQRAIVMHRADYATQEFVDQYGYLGRSWGCTAVDPAIADDLIDTIADGSLMFTYYPDSDWLSGSAYLAGFSP